MFKRCMPERTCIGCRAKRTPHTLLRLACTPDGKVILDRSGRLPGRGAHVCFDSTCLRKALNATKLASAFKRPVQTPTYEMVYETAVDLLNERLGASLGMAQKSGAIISGYTPLRKALADISIAGLILALDIVASRGKEYRVWCARRNIPYLTFFSKERLGTVIGKSARSAVALTESRFFESLCTTKASLDTLHACDAST